MLMTDQDWWELTHSFPIQPGAEDNMIGGPGSVENVTRALQVGVTTVGVFSQYFWRWPYWDDDVCADGRRRQGSRRPAAPGRTRARASTPTSMTGTPASSTTTRIWSAGRW